MRIDSLLTFIRKTAVFIGIIGLELFYLLLSLLPASPLLRVIIAFPCLYILPGFMLLVVLKGNKQSLVKLVILGFFISTVLMVVLASLFLYLKLAQLPFSYSLVTTLLVLPLALFSIVKKRAIQINQSDLILVVLAGMLYIPLILYFSHLPRFFTPDETTYISNAMLGILNIGVPPAPHSALPDTGAIMVLILGRYFWIYLLLSFIASTGVHASNAGILSGFFLIMTAMTSSLLTRNMWLRIATFGGVLSTPLLFIFSGLALNDLAITFYAVFAALFFIKSFQKTNTTVEISLTNLFFALLGVVIIAFVKINILILVGMWLTLVVILVRYKLYKVRMKYKILLGAAVIPVLLYELCLDVPYVISRWFLGNQALSNIFGQFIFISPASKITRWFFTPWWNPASTTLFTRTPIEFIEYFYTLLSPETLGLLFAAIILILPALIISRRKHWKFRTTVLASLILVSFYLYYFDALSLIGSNDINRYSLWMIPLWVPLSFAILEDFKEIPRAISCLQVFIGMCILLLLNVILTIEEGLIVVGYSLPRIWTTGIILTQLLSFSLILVLFFPQFAPRVQRFLSRLPTISKTLDIRTIALALVLIVLFLNSVFFNSLFVSNSIRYSDHGFAEINDAVINHMDGDNLIFSNSYIYMRPVVDPDIFGRGLLLPPPPTRDDFQTLLQVAPNNTLFIIGDDWSAAWYEYANDYIKHYAYVDLLTPESSNNTVLASLNQTEPHLYMSFDDINTTTVLDYSGFENHGINHGCESTPGIHGMSLGLNGTNYVSVPGFELPSQEGFTIGFFALIESADSETNSVLISKGYAPLTGSFTIYVRDGWIYFSLGAVGSLAIQAAPYIGLWHHFIFTYDNEKMEVYVDGSPITSELASGVIRSSPYNLELGRDSEQQDHYFNGSLDVLQITDKSLNHSALIELSFSYYALRVQSLSLPYGRVGVFRLINKIQGGVPNITINESIVRVDEDKSVWIELQIYSPNTKNISILTGTDRFTNISAATLVAGLNDIELEFEFISESTGYGYGGPYWRHMSQVRLIILENNTVVHNELLLLHSPEVINRLLLPIFSGILIVTLVIYSFRRRKSRASEM